MITHDLGVVADIADDVMVMYAGRAAEKGPKRDVFYHPHHPYTTGLLQSIPSSSASGDRLKPIPGQPPSLINLPGGCKFHPRCGYVLDRCRVDEPVLRPIDDGGAHTSACWLPVEAAGLSAEAEALRKQAAAAGTEAPPADPAAEAEAAEADAIAEDAAETAAAQGAIADGLARENDATADNKGSLA